MRMCVCLYTCSTGSTQSCATATDYFELFRMQCDRTDYFLIQSVVGPLITHVPISSQKSEVRHSYLHARSSGAI